MCISSSISEEVSHLPKMISRRDYQRHGQLSIDSQSYGSKTYQMKQSAVFFQVAVVSILLYGCTTWMLTKRMERKLDGNCTRMLEAVLNKFWRQHLTKQQLYRHLPPTSKTIQIRRAIDAGQFWRSKGEHISDVLWWTPSHRQARGGQPVRTYVQQFCTYVGCVA